MTDHLDDKDAEMAALLDLNGEQYHLEHGGYYVRFVVHGTVPSRHIPHGIRYSLTLHDRENNRIIGFDNAHGVKPPKQKRFSGKKVAWDHRHGIDKVYPYEFESAGRLLEDFWHEVEKVLGKGEIL